MNNQVLVALSFILVLVSVGCSTTATQTDLSIDVLHFPKISEGHERIAILGSSKGRVELIDNCIVFNRGYDKPILLWDNQTGVQKVGSSIVITHPQFSTLKVGQRATIKGTLANGFYDPDLDQIPLEPTTKHTCEPTGYLEIYEW